MRATIARFGLLRRFRSDGNAATAIEYALIAGGVAAVIVVAITTLGDSMKTLFYDKLAAMF